MMCLALLAPAVTLSENLPRFKVEVILLPVYVGIYLWLLLSGYVQVIRFNGMFLFGILFCVSIALSLWYGATALGHGLILRDLYEIPRACLPVAFFTLTYEAKLNERSIRRLLNYLTVAFALICLYAWAQFLRLGFSFRLNEIYTAGEHADYSLQVLNRVYATMGNPNVLGQLMDWGIALFLLALLLGVGGRLRNTALLIACFVTLVMTASRYGLLGAILELILVIAIALPTVRNRQKIVQIAALALSLPLFFLVFQVIATSTLGVSARFEQLKHPLEVDSLRVRLDTVWSNAWTFIQASPLLGHGPAKNLFWEVTDSEYLDILREVGVLGFLPYLAYFLFPLAVISRGLRVSYRASEFLEDHYGANCLALRLAFIMGATALLMNVGEGTFHNAPLQGFLWMWLGLGARVSQSFVGASNTNFILPSFQERLTQ